MMMVFKRKEILVGALVILIGAAAVVNYNYNKVELKEAENLQISKKVEEQAESYSVSAIEQTESEDVKMMGEAQQVNVSANEEKNFFEQARMSRENARSKKLEILNGITENEGSDEESKTKARDDIIKMAEYADKEAVCENLIIAKGFEDAVVFIDGESVTVTVKKENFSETEAAKVQEIITSSTGIDTKYIKIVAV